MTNETTTIRTSQKKAKRRLFYTEERAKFTRWDWLVMAALTLVYAAVAFTNLGAHEIAQTYYTMETGDEISVMFAQPEDIATIKYYTSFGTGKRSFQYSLDGEAYTQYIGEIEVKGDDGNKTKTQSAQIVNHVATDMYEWQFIDAAFTAQYVTIHVDQGDLQMLERRSAQRLPSGRNCFCVKPRLRPRAARRRMNMSTCSSLCRCRRTI
jgi:hypothetical protein